MMKMTNEGCRQQAILAAKKGNHKLAMRWYNTAYARTIGHKKSDRYEGLAIEQAKLAGIPHAMDFAKDSEKEEI